MTKALLGKRHEWERLAGETGYACQSFEERDRAVVERVYQADSHVFLAGRVEVLSFLELEYFKDKEHPIFHISHPIW